MPGLSFRPGDRWDGAGDEQTQYGQGRSLASVVAKWYPHRHVSLSSTYYYRVSNRPCSDSGGSHTYFGHHSSRLYSATMQVNFKLTARPLNEDGSF